MLSRTGLRLMCVDDERGALINCKTTIDKIPDVVSSVYFQTAAEAVEHVKSNLVDIVFLDVDLPEISGFALAKQIQTLCPRVKIGFITGDIAYMNASKRQMEAPYLFKPLCDEELMQVVTQMQL